MHRSPTLPAAVTLRRLSALVISLVVTLSLLVPGAIQKPAGATPVPEAGDKILLLHDSVANGARNPIADVFAPRSVEWVGFGGLHVYNVVDILKDRPDLITSHVIVELGTNYDNVAEDFREDIDDLMEILADAEHVLWIKPSIFRVKINEVHAEIDAATRRHPNLHAVDWDAVTSVNTHYTTTDNIHMQGPGGQALADFMHDNLLGVVPWNRIPEGNLGRVRTKGNRVTVKGWAFDPDIKGQIKLQITVDGKPFGNVKTKRKKSKLAKRLGHESSRLGFTRRFNLEPGKHTICVTADNKDGLPKLLIGCDKVTIR